jgi:hypothetical protein
LSGLLLENLDEYEANQEDGGEDEQSGDFAVRPGETRAAPLKGEKKADQGKEGGRGCRAGRVGGSLASGLGGLLKGEVGLRVNVTAMRVTAPIGGLTVAVVILIGAFVRLFVMLDD